MGTDFNATAKQLSQKYNIPEPGYRISQLDVLAGRCACSTNFAKFDHSNSVILCGYCNSALSQFNFVDGRVSLLSENAQSVAAPNAQNALNVAVSNAKNIAVPNTESDLKLKENVLLSLEKATENVPLIVPAASAKNVENVLSVQSAGSVAEEKSIIEMAIEDAVSSVTPTLMSASSRSELGAMPLMERRSKVFVYWNIKSSSIIAFCSSFKGFENLLIFRFFYTFFEKSVLWKNPLFQECCVKLSFNQ